MVHSRVAFALLLLVCILFSTANTKPGPKPELNTTLIETVPVEAAPNRTKRVVPEGFAIWLSYKSISNSNGCAEVSGCYLGYCWSYCGISKTDGEWCYTTRSFSQSFQYEKCTLDWHCEKCWNCAGSCTL